MNAETIKKLKQDIIKLLGKPNNTTTNNSNSNNNNRPAEKGERSGFVFHGGL